MHFLLDENVPQSVARVLREYGHEVSFVGDMVPAGAPDPLVAAASEELGAVLISFDKDFRSIGPRVGLGRRRFRRLSRIALVCSEPRASRRVEQAMSLSKRNTRWR